MRPETLEARRDELNRVLSAHLPSPTRLHPNLSETYRRKVSALAETPADRAIRAPARETLRSLISAVTIHEDSGSVTVELEGAVTAMIGLAQPDAGTHFGECSVILVAGAGFDWSRLAAVDGLLPDQRAGFRI